MTMRIVFALVLLFVLHLLFNRTYMLLRPDTLLSGILGVVVGALIGSFFLRRVR